MGWREELKKLSDKRLNSFDSEIAACVTLNQRVHTKLELWDANGDLFSANATLQSALEQVSGPLEDQIELVAEVQEQFEELHEFFSEAQGHGGGGLLAWFNGDKNKAEEAEAKFEEGCVDLMGQLARHREKLADELKAAHEIYEQFASQEFIMAGNKIKLKCVKNLWIQSRWEKKTSCGK